MAELTRPSPLARLYAFFESTGSERMQGLDESYFTGMSVSEKAQAWDFLKDRFDRSSDCIIGLYLLDPLRAVDLFKEAVAAPIPETPYDATRRDLEGNRVLMLRKIVEIDAQPAYLDAINEFSHSQFAGVRAAFAKAVPRDKVTPGAVAALKGMIYTETEMSPLSAAITKLMSIHGVDYDPDDPLYRSAFTSLMSQDVDEKRIGMQRLEAFRAPAYI